MSGIYLFSCSHLQHLPSVNIPKIYMEKKGAGINLSNTQALLAQTEGALLQAISRMTYPFLSTYPVCREQITLGGSGGGGWKLSKFGLIHHLSYFADQSVNNFIDLEDHSEQYI